MQQIDKLEQIYIDKKGAAPVETEANILSQSQDAMIGELQRNAILFLFNVHAKQTEQGQ